MDTWKISASDRVVEEVSADVLEVRQDGRLVFANRTERADVPYAVVRVVGPQSYTDVIRLQPAGLPKVDGA